MYPCYGSPTSPASRARRSRPAFAQSLPTLCRAFGTSREVGWHAVESRGEAGQTRRRCRSVELDGGIELAIFALTLYSVLGFGVWIGQRISHLDEDREPILVELALTFLVMSPGRASCG